MGELVAKTKTPGPVGAEAGPRVNGSQIPVRPGGLPTRQRRPGYIALLVVLVIGLGLAGGFLYTSAGSKAIKASVNGVSLGVDFDTGWSPRGLNGVGVVARRQAEFAKEVFEAMTRTLMRTAALFITPPAHACDTPNGSAVKFRTVEHGRFVDRSPIPGAT